MFPVTLNNQSKSLKITYVFTTGPALLLYDLTVDGVIQWSRIPAMCCHGVSFYRASK